MSGRGGPRLFLQSLPLVLHFIFLLQVVLTSSARHKRHSVEFPLVRRHGLFRRRRRRRLFFFSLPLHTICSIRLPLHL
jgi:hypothetical protein